MRAVPAILCVVLLLSTVASAEPREEAFRLNEEGLRLAGEGRYPAAIEKLTEARRLLPLEPVLRKNLAVARSEFGSALLSLERFAEAVKEFRLAAALEPSHAPFHTRLGIALLRAKETAQARRAFQKAILVDPEAVGAHAYLGQILYAEGSLRLAINEWEKAIRLDPSRKDVESRLEKARREYAAERNHTRETSPHFEISWDGEQDRSVGSRVLRMLEDAYDQVGVDLGIFPAERVKVILYGEEEFRLVTGAHSWVGGIFDGRIRIPVKNFSYASDRIRRTIGHEYVHVAVQAVTDRCPVWLNEGLAQMFEGSDLRSAEIMARAAKSRNQLLPLPVLAGSFSEIEDAVRARLAYAQSLSLAAFLMREHGPDRVGRFLRHLGEGKSPAEAFEQAFHRSLAQLHAAWEEGL